MRILYGLTIFSFLLFLNSCKKDAYCANKTEFLEATEAFSIRFDEIRANDESAVKADDKESMSKTFEQLVNDCYKKFKPELTLEEKQIFWKSTLKYFLFSLDLNSKSDLNAAIDNPFNVYVKDEVVELVRESGMGFMMSLQELMKDDLPRLMDVFSEEIEKIGKEFLENMFK